MLPTSLKFKSFISAAITGASINAFVLTYKLRLRFIKEFYFTCTNRCNDVEIKAMKRVNNNKFNKNIQSNFKYANMLSAIKREHKKTGSKSLMKTIPTYVARQRVQQTSKLYLLTNMF